MINTNLMLKKGVLPIKSGFTLIELLIVIAVLGILAVAVISAINPIEMINRSKDAGSTSDTEQLISAIDRYYASQTLYPWQAVTTDPINIAWSKVDALASQSNMLSRLQEGTTGQIVGSGELKQAYVNRIIKSDYNSLYIFKSDTADSTSIYVCFKPLSKASQTAAATRCGTGQPPADFPSAACDNTPICGAAGTANCVCLP